MSGNVIDFVGSEDGDMGYLYLPGHPGAGFAGASVKQIRLADLIKYTGVDLYFDFDRDGNLIGIEVIS